MKKCAEVIRKYCDPEYADDVLFRNAVSDLLTE